MPLSIILVNMFVLFFIFASFSFVLFSGFENASISENPFEHLSSITFISIFSTFALMLIELINLSSNVYFSAFLLSSFISISFI